MGDSGLSDLNVLLDILGYDLKFCIKQLQNAEKFGDKKKIFHVGENKPLHVHEFVGYIGRLQGPDLEHDSVKGQHRLSCQGHQAIADAGQHDVYIRTILKRKE